MRRAAWHGPRGVRGAVEKAALPVVGHGTATVEPGECLGALAWLDSSPLYLTPLAWPAGEPVPAHALPPRPHPPRVPTPPARPRLLTPGRRGSSAQTPNCTVATASTAHACYTTSAPGFGAIGVVDTTAQEVDRPAASGGAQWAGRLRLRSVCTSPSQPTWWWTCGASHRDACNGYGRREAQRRSDSELPLVPLRNPVDDSS